MRLWCIFSRRAVPVGRALTTTARAHQLHSSGFRAFATVSSDHGNKHASSGVLMNGAAWSAAVAADVWRKLRGDTDGFLRQVAGDGDAAALRATSTKLHMALIELVERLLHSLLSREQLAVSSAELSAAADAAEVPVFEGDEEADEAEEGVEAKASAPTASAVRAAVSAEDTTACLDTHPEHVQELALLRAALALSFAVGLPLPSASCHRPAVALLALGRRAPSAAVQHCNSMVLCGHGSPDEHMLACTIAGYRRTRQKGAAAAVQSRLWELRHAAAHAPKPYKMPDPPGIDAADIDHQIAIAVFDVFQRERPPQPASSSSSSTTSTTSAAAVDAPLWAAFHKLPEEAKQMLWMQVRHTLAVGRTLLVPSPKPSQAVVGDAAQSQSQGGAAPSKGAAAAAASAARQQQWLKIMREVQAKEANQPPTSTSPAGDASVNPTVSPAVSPALMKQLRAAILWRVTSNIDTRYNPPQTPQTPAAPVPPTSTKPRVGTTVKARK